MILGLVENCSFAFREDHQRVEFAASLNVALSILALAPCQKVILGKFDTRWIARRVGDRLAARVSHRAKMVHVGLEERRAWCTWRQASRRLHRLLGLGLPVVSAR